MTSNLQGRRADEVSVSGRPLRARWRPTQVAPVSEGPAEKLAALGLAFCAAVLLTFGRGSMLAVIGNRAVIDVAIAYFVLGIAPICVLVSIPSTNVFRYFVGMLPLMLFSAWISACIQFNTMPTYWPERSPIVTTILGVLVASRISLQSLTLVRYIILGIGAVFSLMALGAGSGVAAAALARDTSVRFGAEISPANVIAMPRVYYTLALVCFATMLIERRKWLRIAAAPLLIVPLILGFASGSRGPLLGLIGGLVVLLFFARRTVGTSKIVLIATTLACVGFWFVTRNFDLLVQRLFLDDTKRYDMYEAERMAIYQRITFIGDGKGADYAHNIFVETVQDYGLIGLALLIMVLFWTVRCAIIVHGRTRAPELSWVFGVAVIQFIGQQFSLDIYYPQFWTLMVLPVGIALPFIWRASNQPFISMNK